MIYKPVRSRGIMMGSFDRGSDLLESFTNLCRDKLIRLGRVEAIGAVQKARIGYYNQAEKKYEFQELETPLEIVHLSGNISIKDREPFVHVHITLADQEGRCFGGHLAAGTIVFACEYVIEALGGAYLIRKDDPATGLSLWIHDEESS